MSPARKTNPSLRTSDALQSKSPWRNTYYSIPIPRCEDPFSTSVTRSESNISHSMGYAVSGFQRFASHGGIPPTKEKRLYIDTESGSGDIVARPFDIFKTRLAEHLPNSQ